MRVYIRDSDTGEIIAFRDAAVDGWVPGSDWVDPHGGLFCARDRDAFTRVAERGDRVDWSRVERHGALTASVAFRPDVTQRCEMCGEPSEERHQTMTLPGDRSRWVCVACWDGTS